MRSRGHRRRRPQGDADEIAKMAGARRAGHADGAFGLSTGLFYVPGTFTPTERSHRAREGRPAASAACTTSHQRDDASKVLDSVSETIAIGEEAASADADQRITRSIGTANWGRASDTLRARSTRRARAAWT